MTSSLNVSKKESPFKHLFIFKSDKSQFKKKIGFQLFTNFPGLTACQINKYLNEYFNEYEYSLTNE